MRVLDWIDTFWKDVRYGIRMLWSSPGFTAVAVLSLALGIGANSALFSVMDALILRMLPVRDPERLVRLTTPLSFPAYLKVRERNQVFSGMFAISPFPASIRLEGDPEQGVAQLVSADYYTVLGVKAFAGRVLSHDDDRIPGIGGSQGPVGVISYAYWVRRFARNPSVIGNVITLNEVPVTIVGITPPGFTGVIPTLSPDVTVPVMLQPRVISNASTELWVHGNEGSFLDYDLTDDYGPGYVGALKPGVTLAQAQAELEGLRQQILAARAGGKLSDQQRRESAQSKMKLVPAGNGSGLFDPPQRLLLMLIMTAIPGVVLLIACANVANLLLARSAARQKEVAIRQAIGAGRVRLVRQFLTESILLALAGGALGLVLAEWGRRVLLTWLTSQLNFFFSLQAQTNGRVVGFTLAISMAAALIFGLAPAFRSTHADLAPLLKEGGRGTTGGRTWEAGKILVAAQVGLSLLLLICAGLLIRSVRNLQMFDAGYNRENLYVITYNFLGYKGPQTGVATKQIWERMSTLPGANSVGITFNVPPDDRRLKVTVDGYTPGPGQEMYVDRILAGPGMLETMGIPLLAGRTITERDDEKAPKVCVVSAAMAKTFFPNSSPLGHHFTFQRTAAEYEVEIVGVVKDLKKPEAKDVWRAVYCPMLQDLPLGGENVLIRTAGNPAGVLAEARRRFRDIDKDLFLNIKSMDRQVDDAAFLRRFLATLSTAFSLLALLLACVGLYGVMAYSVARRTSEIGIRIALGAGRGAVVAMVLREIMWLVAAGMALGLLAAWGATRLLSSALFGLTAMDPQTLGVAILVMGGVALLAGYAPSRKAAEVDPMIALRAE